MNTSPAAHEQPAPAPAAEAGVLAPEAAAPDAPAVVGRTDPGRRTAHLALAAALACGVVGSTVVLYAASRTWSHGVAVTGGGSLPVHATGSQTTALPGALALVGLAALVAVFAVRRIGRYVVSALLALSGLGAAVVALSRRGDHGALNAAAATATSLAHATAARTTVTFWPVAAAVGGLLLLVAGVLALVWGSRWPAMSGRYERAGGAAGPRGRAPKPIDPERSEDLWKALDRGEDPTGA
ncbi:TIGR02234 family membrane protein [Actinacidiphila yeochonensis]|uniref:TIGR02234 family membrane protein n=1 Tax=Actinacidiphila yeochonensis TaxID=89050 RepID=UPI00056156D6|nr:TIGR02234 family membrane protein [Actinacidiphila yeochonensis]